MVNIKKAAALGGVAIAAAAILSSGAVAANADTFYPDNGNPRFNVVPGGPSFNTATGSVGTAGTNAISDSNVTWDFYAPSHSVFTSATVASHVRDGSLAETVGQVPGCSLVSTTHIHCSGTLSTPASSNGAAPDQYYRVQLQADSTAPLNTLIKDGKMVVTGSNSGASSVTDGSSFFGYKTVASLPTPVIDPAVGAVAAGVLAVAGAGIFVFRRKKAVV